MHRSELSLAFAAHEALIMVVETVELQNRSRNGFRADIAVDHIGLDLWWRLGFGGRWLLRRLFGQLDLPVGQVYFDAFRAMVVALLVFEALLVDLEELLAHEALVVGYLYVAVLAIELVGLLREEAFACDWLLASHAVHFRDELEVAQYGEIQLAWSSAILYRRNVDYVSIDLMTFLRLNLYSNYDKEK